MDWLIWIIVSGVAVYLIYWTTYEFRQYKITKKPRCGYCGKVLEDENLPEYCGPDCYLQFQLERRV